VKFPLLVFEIWCSQGFWDAQMHTHSQMDIPEYRMPLAPKVFSGGGTITVDIWQFSVHNNTSEE